MKKPALHLRINNDWQVWAEFGGRLTAALELQILRVCGTSGESAVVTRMCEAITEALEESLDQDLRAPTSSQLEQAILVAQELNVAIPAQVLRFRGETAAFITSSTPPQR